MSTSTSIFVSLGSLKITSGLSSSSKFSSFTENRSVTENKNVMGKKNGSKTTSLLLTYSWLKNFSVFSPKITSQRTEIGFFFRKNEKSFRKNGSFVKKSNSPNVIFAAVKPLRKPSEELSGPDLENWENSKNVVQELGFEEEEAEKIISKAFGWVLRGYWEDKIVDVVPEPTTLTTVLSYLKELGLEGEDLKRVVKIFPHVLACSVEKRLKINVAQLAREWKISGLSLTKVVIRQPLVLGYSVDCRGDCIAECDHCWARF